MTHYLVGEHDALEVRVHLRHGRVLGRARRARRASAQPLVALARGGG